MDNYFMERSEGIVMQWYEIISVSNNKLSKLRTRNKSSLRQPDEMSTQATDLDADTLLKEQRLHNWVATQHMYPTTSAALGISTPTLKSLLCTHV